MDEFDLIHKYLLPLSSSEGQLLRNDAAVIRPKRNIEYVISTDTLIERIHFTGKEIPKLLAQKALRTNLSDLAAMGADPEFYSLALSIPKKNASRFLKSFSQGLLIDQKLYKIKLIGGDLTSSPNDISITINIIGSVPLNKSVPRDGGNEGDYIYVTGNLGLANIGLLNLSNKDKQFSISKKKYYLPEPRIKFASLIRNFVTSMIDISDGLLQDASHLAKGSKMEFAIDFNKIPLPKIKALSKKKILESALTGGDDYELLFTSPPRFKIKLENIAKKNNIKLTRIGNLRNGKNGEVTYKNQIMNVISYKHF